MNGQSDRRGRGADRVLVVAASVACLCLLVGCGSQMKAAPDASSLSGIVRHPAPVVGRASLPDAARAGALIRLRAAPGGLLLVYFGYTFCPDVCPTTLADLRAALGGLSAEERRRVRVAMITVDPRRDTPKVFTRYLHSFFRQGLPLRTSDQRLLARVARAFGAAYQVGRRKDGTVEVVHTAFVYAVDHQGRVRVQWSYGTKPVLYRKDIRLLLDDGTSAAG